MLILMIKLTKESAQCRKYLALKGRLDLYLLDGFQQDHIAFGITKGMGLKCGKMSPVKGQ